MLRVALTLFAAIALMGMAGCATIFKGSSAPVSINSYPGSANVEIKRSDGLVVEQGQTPMTVKLSKGNDYTVAISLDGYQTQTVPILKSGVETVAFCNVANLLFWGIDYASGAMFKLEPRSINVSLQEVTAQDGGDTVIYAFLTIIGEDGTHQYTAVEMTPVVTE